MVSKYWAYFWGYLNHPVENWLNLVCMLAINILIITLEPDKANKIKTGLKVIYFWIFFQLGLLILHWIFKDLLHINRLSPSAVMEPLVKLSEVLHNPDIKDSSRNSFPAGHTFVAVYWLGFTLLSTKNKIISIVTIIIASLLILPRLFSGAHWFTDILVTTILSLIWLVLALLTLDKIRQMNLCKT
jgi:membrane-associated phospholipid phosphatase